MVVYDTDDEATGGQVEIGNTKVSADFLVSLQSDGSYITSIYGWSSYQPGRGNTNLALKELRRKWPGRITVHECGYPGSASYAYWQHQLDKSRIDEAYDEDDLPLERTPTTGV